MLKPSPRVIVAAVAVVVVLAIGAAFAIEPVTRNLVARDPLCTYCHLEWEYLPTVRLAVTTPHKATAEGGQARCVDCHLPKGTVRTAAAYLHFLSITDLFGRFRDRDSERAGAWIPAHAATTARVRNRLFESEGATCRGCHDYDTIKPKKKRGENAHNKAKENKETCIECHYNLVHRPVELPPDAFLKREEAKSAK